MKAVGGPGLLGRFKGLTRRRKVAIAILFAIAIVVASFSAVTAHTYSEMVKTRILTAVSLDVSIEPQYASGGQNAPMSGLRLRISLLVENPGEMGIRIATIGYRGWIRDVPGESGLDGSRLRVDGVIYTENGTRLLYYPIFLLSWNPNSVGAVVGPEANESVVVLEKTFLRNESEATFANIERIISYGEPQWLHYCMVIMFVEDVPRSYSGLNSYYLSEMVTTRRYMGFPLESGGAGLVNAP